MYCSCPDIGTRCGHFAPMSEHPAMTMGAARGGSNAVHKHTHTRSIFNVHEPQYLGLRPSVITHVNTIVSIFRDWFRRTGMKPVGRKFAFPHCPAIAQVILSPVKLCPPLCDVAAFVPYGMRLSFNNLAYFVLQKVLVFYEQCFLCFLRLFCSSLLVFRMYLEPHTIFILETKFDVRDHFITNIESLLYII
jgi:hypothetical protein